MTIAQVLRATGCLAMIGVLWSGARLQAQQFYWATSDGTVRRGNPGRFEVEDIVTGVDQIFSGIAIDSVAETIYWIQQGRSGRSTVFRASLDGDSVVPVFESDDRFARIEVDPTTRKVYVSGDSGIRRMDFDGDDVDTLVVDSVHDLEIDVLHGNIYYTTPPARGPGTEIREASLDGGENELILFDPRAAPGTVGLALDPVGGKLYWIRWGSRAENNGQVLQRANLDGTEVEELAQANSGLDDFAVYLDIDVTNQKLYWVNSQDGVFYSANTDGSTVERFGEARRIPGPFGFAFYQPDSTLQNFRRGDCNSDGSLNVTDGVCVLVHLFRGGEAPPCLKSVDANDSGELELSDAVFLLSYLFRGGLAPPEPFASCGQDSTFDALTCGVFAACP